MKLPFSFGQKKEPIEYFLALLLRDETVSVVVLEEKAQKLHLITPHTVQLSSPLEEIDTEDLLDVLDKAITFVEDQLPKNASLHKTVFGLKESWIEDAHIKKTYLTKLKKISEELDLKPLGFLVFSEAIAHLLQQEEGAPVSAILVEIGKKTTAISLLRAGKVTETHTVQNEHHITKTIETVLGEITSSEILPSRIILFDSEDSGKTANTLLSHSWNKELPFLHVPQVHVLPAGFDIKAVLFGTAAQLGFSADLAHIELPQQKEKDPETKEASKEETKEKEPVEEEKITTDNFTAADFGFALEKDVAKDMPKDSTSSDNDEDSDTLEEDSSTESKHTRIPNLPLLKQSMHAVHTLTTRLKKLVPQKKAHVSDEPIEREEPTEKRPLPKILIVLPIIAIILVGLVLFYIFKEKAIVTITITPTTNTQSENVIFSAADGNNFDNNQIGGSITTLTEDGTLQGHATGTKSIGDKAKGTVTVYNSSDTGKTVMAGTTITTANGLKFTIDKDVSVASASGDIFSGTKPGTVDATVTASDIGTDFNLPSGTKFSVGGSTQLAAKNADAFSGGSKKQVTVISKDDQSKLVDQLTKNLQDKAQTDMNNQANGDKVLLPVFLSTSVTKKNFDKNVGDQASTVTLTESLSFQAMAYAKQDLQDYAEKIFKDKISSDQRLAANGVTAEVSDVKQKDDKHITATAQIKAKVYGTLNTNTLLQSIKGQSFTKAENFLNNQQQVSHVEITLNPNIFFLPKLLPRSEKNITITIQQE